jgi:hypothetical protein
LAFDDVVEHQPLGIGGLLHGTNRQRWQVLEWLGGIDARGGTEMRPAITQAMQLFSATNQSTDTMARQQILVIVTDGQVTGEDAILRGVAKFGTVKPRIFTVGIDRAVNAAFLRRLADSGHGTCELVESEDRLDAAMDRIHRLIGAPVLTGMRLEPLNFDWVSDSVAPSRMPDLFADRPVVIQGRHLSKDAIRLRIHALDAAGQAWSAEVMGQPGPAGMLISTWGRARVRDLEDEYASGTSRDANRLMQQIVEVSLESHVLSRFTAYVAVDRSEVVNQGGRLQPIIQPVEVPEGWQRGIVCSIAAPPAYGGAMTSGGLGKMRSLSRRFSKFKSAPSSPGKSQLRDAGSSDALAESFFTGSEPPADSALSEGSELIVRFVHMLITEALRLGATEIRIEPLKDRVLVQYRIKRKWVDRDSPPLRVLPSLIGHIFKLANLDLAQIDVPQQGQFPFAVNAESYLWEVTTSKTAGGMSVVMTLNAADEKRKKQESKRQTTRKKFWT